MKLPLYGKMKLFDTSKEELLGIWQKVLSENNIVIQEHKKLEQSHTASKWRFQT